MKKNRAAVLIAVLSALALLIAVYALLAPKLGSLGNSETAAETEMLASYDSANIKTLSYTHGGETVSLIYDDIWYIDGDRGFPLNQNLASAMGKAISSIPIERKFTPDEISRSDTGLDKPDYTISVSYKDGTEKTYKIGAYNSFNNNYYFAVEGDDSIYMIPAGLNSSFNYTFLKLASFDTLPTLAETDIKSYDIVKDGQTVNITDSDLLKKLTALYFVDCAAYKPDQALLDSFGLGENAPSIVVHYSQKKAVANEETSISSTAGVTVDYDMTFTVGSLCEGDDTLRYVRYNDSPLVYAMSASTMEALLQMQ